MLLLNNMLCDWLIVSLLHADEEMSHDYNQDGGIRHVAEEDDEAVHSSPEDHMKYIAGDTEGKSYFKNVIKDRKKKFLQIYFSIFYNTIF